MMEKINKDGIAICQKAYLLLEKSKLELDKAVYDSLFTDVYAEFEVWAMKQGLTNMDTSIGFEKFQAYVKLYGEPPQNHSKQFSSIRRYGSRVCQTRTTMISDPVGKTITMPEKVKQLAGQIILKGVN